MVEVVLSGILDRAPHRNAAGEIVGLQWGDLDFRGKFIMLRRQFTRGRIEPTKTSKIRRVDMSDSLAAELQALKKKRQADYLKKGSNEIPEWVFINQEGNPLDYYNLKRRHFEKCLEHGYQDRTARPSTVFLFRPHFQPPKLQPKCN